MTPGAPLFSLSEGCPNPRLKGWRHRGIPLEKISDSVVWEAMACASSPGAARAVRLFAAVRGGDMLKTLAAREHRSVEQIRQLANRGFRLVATYAIRHCAEYLPLVAEHRGHESILVAEATRL